jgi:hypothetical protein
MQKKFMESSATHQMKWCVFALRLASSIGVSPAPENTKSKEAMACIDAL